MKAPYHSLGILEVLSGRNPKVVALRNKAKVLATHVSPNYGGGGGGGGSGGGYGDGYGGMDGLAMYDDLGLADYGDAGGVAEQTARSTKTKISEQQAQQAQPVQRQQPAQQPQRAQQPAQKKMISKEQFNKILIAQIDALKKDPTVQASLQTSPVVKEMQQSAFEAVAAAANPVLKAANYQQLKSALGQEFNKFEMSLKKTLPPGATPEQDKQFKEALVPEIKLAYKKMLITQLQKQIGNNQEIAKPMQQLIAKISKS